MSHDLTAGEAGPTEPWVAELIPGEDIFVVLNPAAGLPDEDAIDEMRIQAYERRDAPVMGSGTVEVVQTLASWAASGVVGGAAFAPFPATWAYLQRWRDRRRASRVTVEQAIDTAMALCPKVLRREPEDCEVVKWEQADDGWRLRLRVDSIEYEFMIDSTGSVASFEKLTGRRSKR